MQLWILFFFTLLDQGFKDKSTVVVRGFHTLTCMGVFNHGNECLGHLEVLLIYLNCFGGFFWVEWLCTVHLWWQKKPPRICWHVWIYLEIFFYPCSIKKYTYRLKYIHEHSLKYFSAEGSMRSLNLKKTGVFSFLLVIMIEYN